VPSSTSKNPSSAASKKLLTELPSKEEMDKILRTLNRSGDKAAALLGAAYLESELEQLLSAFFRPLGKEDRNRMFSPQQRGVLSTFDAKIRVAYAAKLLHVNAYHALLLIAGIRNVFAHSLHDVDFKHPLVVHDCQRLAAISANLGDSAKIAPDSPAIDIYSGIVRTLYVSLYLQIEDLTTGRRG
jgi:hypothetical protein